MEFWGLVVGNNMYMRETRRARKGGVPGGGGCSGFVPESVPGLSVACKLWLTGPCLLIVN